MKEKFGIGKMTNPTSKKSVESSEFYTEGTIEWLLKENVQKINELVQKGIIVPEKDFKGMQGYLPRVADWIENKKNRTNTSAEKRDLLSFVALAQKLIAEKESETINRIKEKTA